MAKLGSRLPGMYSEQASNNLLHFAGHKEVIAVVYGIALFVFVCLIALGIVAIAGKSIREYDEKNHESYLG
ncbi:hypothetical protein [Paenibacillus sp. MBLB4367]|uniref:hypothetical protein n=1 Tax=Paenibacillus sp. MBLB4367 TaxID=3384767 RepID=UPI003907FC11